MEWNGWYLLAGVFLLLPLALTVFFFPRRGKRGAAEWCFAVFQAVGALGWTFLMGAEWSGEAVGFPSDEAFALGFLTAGALCLCQWISLTRYFLRRREYRAWLPVGLFSGLAFLASGLTQARRVLMLAACVYLAGYLAELLFFALRGKDPDRRRTGGHPGNLN